MAEFARGRVCRGRLCQGPSLSGAEFVRSRVCQGPSLLGAEMSSIHYDEAKTIHYQLTKFQTPGSNNVFDILVTSF